MKIYVIMQRATEYNDEYDEVQEEGAKIYKAYSTRAEAEANLGNARWEAIQDKTPMDGEPWPNDIAYIEEIEVEPNDAQVVRVVKEVGRLSREINLSYTLQRARTAHEQAEEASKEAVRQSLNQLFRQYPDLTSLKWTQYTPYFNDGDECVFRVGGYNNVDVKLATVIPGLDEEDGFGAMEYLYYRQGSSDKMYIVSIVYDSGYSVNFSYGKRGGSLVSGTKTLSPVCYQEAEQIKEALVQEKLREGYQSLTKDVKDFLSLPKEGFKSLFGDHVEVTVTPNGTEVEPYDHD